MSKARAAEQPRPVSDGAERERREVFMAAVDDGLADLKAGRVYTHAQVQDEMRKRFPPPTK